MANSRYDVEIRGDNKGLTAAVNNSMEELNKLDSAANGLFSGLTGPLNNLKQGLNVINTMSPAMKGLGVAGLAASAGLMAINKASSVVGVLTQINTNTGVSIEMLQQLQKEFKSTGMDVEKFGDINKDAMDKLGDSFRNGGGGIADDLKEWGIGLETLTKYAGDAEGGIKAVIDVFYQMKQAGKSQAEIVNAMESMASDSSHLISTLEQYTSAQEALNSIQSQTVAVTSDVAEEFQEWDRNVQQLGRNIDEFTVNSVSPLVKEMNEVWKWFDDMDWENSKFAKWLKENNKKGMSPSGMSSGQVQNIGKTAEDIEIEKREAFIKENAKLLQKDIKNAEAAAKQKREADAANAAILKRQAEDAKRESDKAQRERESAAAKAKAQYDKMMAERAGYLQTMSQLDIAVISSEGRAVASQMNQIQQTLANINKLQSAGILSIEQATERRNQLLANSAKEFKDQLVMNPDDIGLISQSVEQAYQMQLEQLKAKLSQELLTTQQYNSQKELLEQDHQARMKAIQEVDANTVNLKNLSALGFATDEEEIQIQMQALEQQLQKMREQNQSMYDNELISYDDFLKQKQRLDQAYSVKSKAIAMAEIQTKMQMYNGFAQGMAGVIGGIAGENSKAAQAAFAVAKGTAIAQGMLNAYESATTAMAKYPGPLGYALAASSYASVLGQVMSMKSVSPNGMAHDGIDNIPKEGTWLLDGGERVVDQRTNGDLKDFLESNKDGGTQTIDASMTINGNVTDERWFAVQLKKHQQAITSIVQDGNRRKM
ncbi:coiled-coil domain-containing protein [Klebsiella aerogenes]|uniref:hypothetical protein n=1 Tax=Klebsiella aerogenes TaxID=548 RepID=UPI002278F68C|nr:hypothetical protein [Klebsiella aerogenes]MCY4762665.1 hypothetical protein [Klebsiella aerogenes]